MKLLKGTFLGAVLAGMMLVMSAASNAQTINDIVNRGKVLIGVNSGAPPFSFVDSHGKAQGLDVDLANLIAHYLGVPAEITTYTTAARIPALEAGKVDMMIATLGATPARAKVVMFTMSYNVFPLVIVAHKADTFKTMNDLVGKKVAVARGTPQEASLMRAAPKGTELSRFDDDLTATQALISGQVQAAAIPQTIYQEILKSRPNADIKVEFSFHNDFQSIAVRKDAFELHQWLNTTLAYIKGNGELDALAIKWTGHPMPKDMPVF
ncbi:MAG TPA: transporter substrate-binding domain-containing protein [Castellaniella sp.]|uniref:transporter substrate-binding domain-containing protein n=1 Tax=Castellaniella sp. TaxID=1955812 RepID=UPI002F12301C